MSQFPAPPVSPVKLVSGSAGLLLLVLTQSPLTQVKPAAQSELLTQPMTWGCVLTTASGVVFTAGLSAVASSSSSGFLFISSLGAQDEINLLPGFPKLDQLLSHIIQAKIRTSLEYLRDELIHHLYGLPVSGSIAVPVSIPFHSSDPSMSTTTYILTPR